MERQFKEFVKSDFGLEIYSGEKLIFRSKKEGIKGLLEFIKKNKKATRDLIVFDKKVGNAVALLLVYLKVKEVWGVIGSKSAEKTFKKFKIKFHFLKTISHILDKTGTDICPLEKLSLSKSPKNFLDSLKNKDYF